MVTAGSGAEDFSHTSYVVLMGVVGLIACVAGVGLLAAGFAMVRQRKRSRGSGIEGEEASPIAKPGDFLSDAMGSAEEGIRSFSYFPSLDAANGLILQQPKAATKSVLQGLGFIEKEYNDSFDDADEDTTATSAGSSPPHSKRLGKIKFTLAYDPERATNIHVTLQAGRIYPMRATQATPSPPGISNIDEINNNTIVNQYSTSASECDSGIELNESRNGENNPPKGKANDNADVNNNNNNNISRNDDNNYSNVFDNGSVMGDIFIRATLLPCEAEVRQTKKIFVNPKGHMAFGSNNQSLVFKAPSAKLIHTYSLCLTAVRQSSFEPLAEAILPLKDLAQLNSDSITTASTTTHTLEMKPSNRKINGSLLVTLLWKPELFRLKVTVNSAANLLGDINSLDTYVKVALYNGEEQFAGNKTTVQVASANPDYEESFVFNLSSIRLENLRCELSLVRLSSRSEVRGVIKLGAALGASETEVGTDGFLHFLEMLSKPGHGVPAWHPFTLPDARAKSPQSLLKNPTAGVVTGSSWRSVQQQHQQAYQNHGFSSGNGGKIMGPVSALFTAKMGGNGYTGRPLTGVVGQNGKRRM